MCSLALQTHLFYRELVYIGDTAAIRRETNDYLNKAADNAAARGKGGRLHAIEEASGAEGAGATGEDHTFGELSEEPMQEETRKCMEIDPFGDTLRFYVVPKENFRKNKKG